MRLVAATGKTHEDIIYPVDLDKTLRPAGHFLDDFFQPSFILFFLLHPELLRGETSDHLLGSDLAVADGGQEILTTGEAEFVRYLLHGPRLPKSGEFQVEFLKIPLTHIPAFIHWRILVFAREVLTNFSQSRLG
jgi:hypothetical protein